MDEQALTPLDVAARVVAWHNRHPLARRIDVKDVHSLGVVALPWSTAGATEPPTSRLERLKGPVLALVAKLRRKPPPVDAEPATRSEPLRAAFSEDFIPGTPTARIAAFVRQHGREDSPAPDHWPMRQVHSDADVTDTWLYILTAAIGTDGQRPRLLLSAAPRAVVLGRRMWDRRRMMVAGVAGLLLVAGLVGIGLWVRSRQAPAHDAAAAPAVAASAASTPQATASAPPSAASVPEAAASSVAAASSATSADAASAAMAHASSPSHPGHAASAAEAPEAAASGSASAPAASGSGAATASLGPASSGSHDEQSLERRETARTLSTKEPESTGRLSPTRSPLGGAPANRPAESPPPAASSISEFLTQDRQDDARTKPPRHFALMSRGARSRAAAEALLPRVQAAAKAIDVDPDDRNVHIEVIQAKGGWHAVWWPFPDQRSATEARWALALKGVTVDLVDF